MRASGSYVLNGIKKCILSSGRMQIRPSGSSRSLSQLSIRPNLQGSMLSAGRLFKALPHNGLARNFWQQGARSEQPLITTRAFSYRTSIHDKLLKSRIRWVNGMPCRPLRKTRNLRAALKV